MIRPRPVPTRLAKTLAHLPVLQELPQAVHEIRQRRHPVAVETPHVHPEPRRDLFRVLAGEERDAAVKRLDERRGQGLVDGRVDQDPSSREQLRLSVALDMREHVQVRRRVDQPARTGAFTTEMRLPEHQEVDLRKPTRKLGEHPRTLDRVEAADEEHTRTRRSGRHLCCRLQRIAEEAHVEIRNAVGVAGLRDEICRCRRNDRERPTLVLCPTPDGRERRRVVRLDPQGHHRLARDLERPDLLEVCTRTWISHLDDERCRR